jgi:shikimate kinase/3-dehydroquinate synthase
MSHIFLYGPPGSGKSTIGRLLAKRLERPFIDIDSEIEKSAGKAITQIFEDDGEISFRNLESSTICQFSKHAPSIIALGGGALLRPQNRECAETHGSVLCFTADLQTLQARVSKAPNQRPLIKGEEEPEKKQSPLAKLLKTRAAHYGSFPLTLKVSDMPAESTTDNVQMILGQYRVSGMGNPYSVYTGPNLLQKTGELFIEAKLGERCVIVGDENTAPLYGTVVADSLEKSGIRSSLITIPAGESHKTIDTVGYLWKQFMEAGIERGDTVIAMGGGVTGDLTGFAAATWLRGIKWVSMPTTLLAMCDSGLGGKTGADLPEGKNLIGAFHPPALVIADTQTLATLPVREIRCGLAESIKHAVIADPGLLDTLEKFTFCKLASDESICESLRNAEWLPQFVARSMAVKIRIICEDPFEKGVRASLNLGHTIGHGIEVATGFALQHGEAVAIGTVREAEIAEAMQLTEVGVAESLSKLFSKVGLPVNVPAGIDIDEVLKAITKDKKKAGGKIHFALPIAIGKVQTGVIVENDLLRKKISR